MDISSIEIFQKSHRINSKGSLAAVLQLNRAFSRDVLPINPNDYLTDKEGQVKGLSKDNCQSILEEYQIRRLLAAEGGRTSRGSVGLMKDYATLINEKQPSSEDFGEIERFWIEQIRKFLTVSLSDWNRMIRFRLPLPWGICWTKPRNGKRKTPAQCMRELCCSS
ncbi:DUF4928 family protein [Bifidobacterium sp. UTCIF-39]|uniref:DUF4928 family protein n=1 Tax=Bifidobacterium sp. UTCIF-39 TaxID=1465359 RepID=UPI00215947BE|nr:DUF4928 family protein [Bifidobacterium sp. UTCIF-39]